MPKGAKCGIWTRYSRIEGAKCLADYTWDFIFFLVVYRGKEHKTCLLFIFSLTMAPWCESYRVIYGLHGIWIVVRFIPLLVALGRLDTIVLTVSWCFCTNENRKVCVYVIFHRCRLLYMWFLDPHSPLYRYIHPDMSLWWVITEMVLLPLFAIYNNPLLGSKPMAYGWISTGIISIAEAVVGFITETVLSNLFATYKR
jgi:hypothetical protein